MVEAASEAWGSGDVVAEKYVLERALARGGMGVVWAARNRLTERRVAIKFILPELAANPEAIQRFFREARASARIDHPSIVDVLDVGTLPSGVPFMVMEYLDGRSLDWIVERTPLSCAQSASIVLEVVRALDAAHAAGIVHRDLKPANVFIARRGELVVPKILDFGISKVVSANAGDPKMTRTGTVMGSPSYMSPEQARGLNDLDGRADVWAIGVILFEAVSGRLPFVGENYNQIMMSITLDDPAPLVGVDDAYRAIVAACMRKDRASRPQTMGELASMLGDYLATAGAPAPLDLGAPASIKTTIGLRRVATIGEGATVAGSVSAIPTPMIGSTSRLAIAIAGVAAIAGLVVFGATRASMRAPMRPVVSPDTTSASSPPTTSEPESTSVPSVSTTPSSASAASVAADSTSIEPTASSAPPKKKWTPVVRPKPKTKEGPASVGEGPGF